MLLSDTNTQLSSPVAHRALSDSISDAHISSDCGMLLRRPIHRMHHTGRKNTLHVSLWCWCAYKILRNKSQPAVNSRLLFPEWGGICRSHISRRVLDFSEVLIQLLNHRIIPLFFSPRTRSQVMLALLCHGRLAQYCCVVCPRFFVFVCNSSRFRTNWTKCNSSSFRYENSSGWNRPVQINTCNFITNKNMQDRLNIGNSYN